VKLRIVKTTFSFFNLQPEIRNFITSCAAPLHDELRGGEQEDHGNSVVQWL
jgi:hypothetical protein